MILSDSNQYGVLSELVSGAGSLIAAAAALALGWRGRTNWEPSEQDVERGPQKVGSLLAVIAIAILWARARNPVYIPKLSEFAVILGIIAVIALLLYGFMANTFTYYKIVSGEGGGTRQEKIIGGLWLNPAAKKAKEKAEEKGRTLKTQDILAKGGYDPDNVWTRPSRGLSKAIFVVFYLALTVPGTIALASASIILGLSQAKAPEQGDRAYSWEYTENGMPQLSREFNLLLKSNQPMANRLAEFKGLKKRHDWAMNEMARAEAEPFRLARPYKVVSLLNYISMANYHLATISLIEAEMETDARLASAHRNSADEYAKACIDFAAKASRWNQAIVNNDTNVLAGNSWSPETLKESRAQLLAPDTAIARDIKWYATAGKALRSYYGKIPFEEVYPQVLELKRESSAKDPPEDDPAMAWVLYSTDGTRPQASVADIAKWR